MGKSNMLKLKKKSRENCHGLNGNQLKAIAITAMTIDHLAWTGIEEYSQAETPVQISLHTIGRLTAPIMFYAAAEGYHHTRNFPRYLERMAIMAGVSHFAFCFFNRSGFNPLKNRLFNATSITWPLMWGLILLKVWDSGTFETWQKELITIIACLMTFTSDWSCAAPMAILMMGRNRGDFEKQMLWLIVIIMLYAAAFYMLNNHTYGMVHLAGILAVPLLALYNGQRGKAGWMGSFFYWYYPVHMVLIGILARFIPSWQGILFPKD